MLKKVWLLLAVMMLLPVAVPVAQAEKAPVPQPTISLHGDTKYKADFRHFEYVNPNAPKGGSVVIGAIGTFDSLNPFLLKGVPEGNVGMLFDTLMVQSLDEPFSLYPLTASTITLPEDRAWVEFTLNPKAAFADGSPVTPEDVIFSLHTLRDKGHPQYKAYFSAVTKAEKKGKLGVRFTLQKGVSHELPLILGVQMPILSKKYYSKYEFSRTTLEAPLGSGAYTVSKVEPGRSITFQRRESYWAKDLPSMRGQNNFDTIRVDYYRDDTVAIEALKAGKFDFRAENVARNWAEAYNFPAVKEGKFIKDTIPNQNPAGMQGFIFNTRKPMFQNRKVREAIGYAYDFEWQNKTLFYGSYTRSKSYFSNSEMAATGLPQGKELKILEPFRASLPPEVFTNQFTVPEYKAPQDARQNLRRALTLFREAEYALKEGKMVSKDGKPLTFEILLPAPTFERVAQPFAQNLAKMGVTATIRVVDSTQYELRTRNFDFDMVVHVFGQSLNPGNEQHDFWHSSVADVPGSANLIGIKDKTVDALVGQLIAANSRESLVAHAKALDRVLLWHHFVVPQYHLTTWRLAYWNKFGKPAVAPKYNVGFPATWWIKDAAAKP